MNRAKAEKVTIILKILAIAGIGTLVLLGVSMAKMLRQDKEGSGEKTEKILSTVGHITPPEGASFHKVGDKVAVYEEEDGKGMYIKLEKGTKVGISNYTYTLPDGSSKEIKVISPLGE